MARFANRDPRTGRWTVDTSGTQVDSKFDPITGIDVQVPGSSPADLAYETVESGRNVVANPQAPAATDAPEAETARPRLRTQATGLRSAYSRTDQHLIERAQAGTSLLPGTQTGDIPTGDKAGTP